MNNRLDVAVIGAGQIGMKISEMLFHNGMFNVSLYDANNPIAKKLDVSDIIALHKVVNNADIIISALPHTLTATVAKAVIRADVPRRRTVFPIFSKGSRIYLDLTEDVSVGREIRNMAKGTNAIVVPHCGLAPGAVSIIAASMMREFDEVQNVSIKVGALPIACDNPMQYYRSWSTDGLINECRKECPQIVGGKEVSAFAMAGLTTVNIDGSQYESFNTSGGSGTLHETILAGGFTNFSPTGNMRYQTLRYPGHEKEMSKLLVQKYYEPRTDQQISEQLEQDAPLSLNDVVVILIQVNGVYRGKKNFTKIYTKKIYSDSTGSAIQKTTASGVVSVVELLSSYDVPNSVVYTVDNFNGWLPLESLDEKIMRTILTWKSVYGNKE